MHRQVLLRLPDSQALREVFGHPKNGTRSMRVIKLMIITYFTSITGKILWEFPTVRKYWLYDNMGPGSTGARNLSGANQRGPRTSASNVFLTNHTHGI